METFLGGLALAAVSGLTYVAYRHPKGYHNLFPPVSILSVSAVLCLAAYNFGILSTVTDSLLVRSKAASSDSLASVSSLIIDLDRSVAVIGRCMIVAAAVLAYLVFLYYLPAILGLEQQDSKPPSGSGAVP